MNKVQDPLPNKITSLHSIVKEFNATGASLDKAKERIDSALEKGLEIDACNNANQTPLHECQRAEIVEYLIDQGANPNIQDIHGKTPLFYSESIEVVKALLSGGATLDFLDNKANTILESHIESYLNHSRVTEEDKAIQDKRWNIIKLLIEQGAKLSPNSYYKRELLEKAIEWTIGSKSAENSHHANCPLTSEYSFRKNCLAIAKDLISLGADLEDPASTMTFLYTSFESRGNSGESQEGQAFYFEIVDKLITLLPKLAEYDQDGQLLKTALQQVIGKTSTLWNPQWHPYYLKFADKLSTMNFVHLDIADPKGELLRQIYIDVINQDPSTESSSLDMYFQVADRLIQLGASPTISDPNGELIKYANQLAGQQDDTKKRDFYLNIAKELVARWIPKAKKQP